MARGGRRHTGTVGGTNWDDLEVAVQEVQEQLDGGITFGTAPPHGTVGSRTNNGELAHLRGSFVRQQFTVADTPVVFQHNLGVVLNPDAKRGNTNVLWLVMHMEHDGTGVNAASTLSINYERPDPMTTSAISLRCYVGGGRTVDATHPVHVVLFFTPAY